MMKQLTVFSAAFALSIAIAPFAQAQQPSAKSEMSNMPDMKTDPAPPKDQDMTATMKRCANMRQQMKPGATLSADMQKQMAQCDAMDRSMDAPPQPYVPPAQRRR
jgi:hypothetical protein